MARYAEAHKYKNIAGPGDARPTALQIIRDEGLTGKLSDMTCLITGVSSGIGIETLRALHTTGGHIIGTSRNLAKGQKVVDQILSEKLEGGGKISLVEMDDSSLTSVRAGAKAVLEKGGRRLNVIVANAGVMAIPEEKTANGFERQFATNHLGHFLLFQLLKDALLSSATPECPSWYVSVSSKALQFGGVRLHDYFFEKDPYNEWLAYGQSKTVNIWMSNYIERHYGHLNLYSTSLHPGVIVETGLAAHLDISAFDNPDFRKYCKNAAQGAATQVLAAVGREWSDRGGVYLSNCAEGITYEEGKDGARVEAWNDRYKD